MTSDSGPPGTARKAAWAGTGGVALEREKISMPSLSGSVTQTSWVRGT
jgi:hypothetical protein